jgi:hypothetical protein
MKTQILCSIVFFFRKLRRLRDNVGKKNDKARQATDGNIIWCMHFACWITKATHTQR